MSMPDQERPACPEVRPGSQPIALPPVPAIPALTFHTWGQGGAWDGLGWASAEASEGEALRRRRKEQGYREEGHLESAVPESWVREATSVPKDLWLLGYPLLLLWTSASA